MLLTDAELDLLRDAAQEAWGDDTRHLAHRGNPRRCVGQCFVTARWVQSLHGGHVARKSGHYFWLSPNKALALDLSGDAHGEPDPTRTASGAGPVLYEAADHPFFADGEIVPDVEHPRAALFVRRADRALAALKKGVRLSIDFAGDAFPGSEPQYVEDHGEGFLHDDPFTAPEARSYNVVYANGELHLSADDSHDDLARHALIEPSHTGPFAAGFVTVDPLAKATWQLHSNVSLNALMRVLKDYGKTVGWEWGGLTDATGQPISDDFAPKKSRRLYWGWVDEELLIGTDPYGIRLAHPTNGHVAVVGTIDIEGDLAKVAGLDENRHMFDAVKEWADDEGLRLMAGDNVIKRIEDLQQKNLWSPTDNEPEGTQFFHEPKRDERSPGGVYKCPECAQIFPSWQLYIQHRSEEEPVADSAPEADDSGFPDLPDMDKPIPANFTEMDRGQGMHVASASTGDQRLDALIAEFAPQVESYRDWQNALTNCNDACERFVAFLKDHSYQAEVIEGDYAQFGLEGIDVPWHKERDHAVTLVQSAAGPVTVDWTASQYGHSAFPMVRRASASASARVAVIRTSRGEWTAYMGGFKVGSIGLRSAPEGVLGIIGWIDAPNDHVADALISRVKRAYVKMSALSFADESGWEDENSVRLARHGFYRISASMVRWAKDADPSQELEGPVPFIYDVDKDEIHTGAPGGRHAEIHGKFTPAGIVEGIYEPGGKVIIRSITNMPYTVRHMLELWYYTHPHLVIKSVHLRDDEGKDTKLATTKRSTQDVGQYIANLVASDDVAWRAYKALSDAGGHVFAVGGAVRDALMGKDPKDIDLMVTGLPADQVEATLKRLPGKLMATGELAGKEEDTGKAMGVFHYREGGADGHAVEIALPRRERSTGALHQDFDVQTDHTMTPQEDFYRRDFTVNAMGVDLDSGKLVDPFGGADDLERGQFRTLNANSLTDDPLRTVRALALRARHGLEPDDDTRRQMRMAADGIGHLPAERLRAELDKVFGYDQEKDEWKKAPYPSEAIRLAHETGLLGHILPEVDAAFGYNQDNPHHEQELGEHLLSVLKHTAAMTDDPDLRLAALLHDIGKPASRWNECVACTREHDGTKAVRPLDHKTCLHCGNPLSGHYYAYHHDNPNGSATVHGAAHEDVGAEMARERLEALKYPTKRTARIGDLVAHHMYTPFTSEKGARKFLNRVGDHADDLMKLRIADQGGKSAYDTDPTDSFNVERERDLVNAVREKGEATSMSNLAVNGHDVIQHLGIKPGPQVGQILRGLTDHVLEDPSQNEREALLERAQELAA